MEINVQGGPIFVDVSRGDGPEEVVEYCEQSESEAKTGNDEKSRQDSSGTYPEAQTRRVRCPECARFTAENEEKMLRHIRKVHRGENPFQCSICDYNTYNKCMFEEHVRIHQGIKPFKCPKCPYRSVSKKNTKKHELIHRPDNPLRCGKCGFVARHTRSFQCHIKKHHDEDSSDDTIKCKSFDGTYKKNELEDHKESGGKCIQCSFIACNKRALARHMVEIHGEARRKLQGPTFSCAICQWSSKNKPRILLHLIHHPQVVNEADIDVTVLRKYGIIGS